MRLRQAWGAVWIVVGLVLSACSSAGNDSVPDSGAAKFLGEQAVAFLRDADRCESFRVQREPGVAPPHEVAIAGVKRLADGPPLDGSQRAQLRRLLFDDASYEFEMSKSCIPMPGVLLRAWKGDHYVDVSLCFECEMWGVSVDTPPEKFPTEWEDFDPVTPQLVALVKALFPDDLVIQGL